jgi:DNA-binding transcriptional LysR family regulator
MQRLLFDLVDLRLFVNIAEASSLTRGAERSCTSLAAASMRIKNLEDALGTKLFYRTSGGVTPTPAGEAMLRNALLILQQTERLHGDLLEYADGIKGRIRMFANTTAMTEFLPAALGTFLASRPQLDVELQERMSDDIIRALQDGAIDIGIVAGTVRTEGLQVLPYQKDRLVLATAREHPLAQRRSIAFAEALGYDFVSLHAGSAIYAFMNRIVSDQGGTMSVRVQVSSFDALCRMVEANAGIGVLQRSAARRHMRTAAIQVVELTDPWAERALKICVRDLEALPTFARELVDYLVATVPASEASIV